MPKVYVVNRPVKNKFGWVPDLSDATRYGTLEVVFEPEDKPQYVPGPSIQKARRIMKDFSPEDYVLWPGGGSATRINVSMRRLSGLRVPVMVRQLVLHLSG